MKLTEVEIARIAEFLREYSDCLFEQSGWCGDFEGKQILRDDAAESIELAEKIEGGLT
jgi:hypothetical protein